MESMNSVSLIGVWSLFLTALLPLTAAGWLKVFNELFYRVVVRFPSETSGFSGRVGAAALRWVI